MTTAGAIEPLPAAPPARLERGTELPAGRGPLGGLSPPLPLMRRTTGTIRAVDGINLTLAAGETLGLVGESGCGKSTTGQAILQLIPPTSGRVVFRGQDLTTLSRRELQPFRREMQIVLQDPFSSLDPRMTVGQIIAEPLVVHGLYPGLARRRRVNELMDLVGLPPALAARFPTSSPGVNASGSGSLAPCPSTLNS